MVRVKSIERRERGTKMIHSMLVYIFVSFFLTAYFFPLINVGWYDVIVLPVSECKWTFKEGDVAVLSTPRPGTGLLWFMRVAYMSLIYEFNFFWLIILNSHHVKQSEPRGATPHPMRMMTNLRSVDVWLVLLDGISLSILVTLMVQSSIFLLGTRMTLTGYFINLFSFSRIVLSILMFFFSSNYWLLLVYIF